MLFRLRKGGPVASLESQQSSNFSNLHLSRRRIPPQTAEHGMGGELISILYLERMCFYPGYLCTTNSNQSSSVYLLRLILAECDQ